MNRLTKKEFEWYDDFVTNIEDEYDIDETNDVMYRKLKALEDIEEELDVDLFTLLNNLKKVLEILDIIKRSIYSKEIHKYVMNEKLKGQKFMSIGLSIRGDDDINKIKEWLKNE